MKEVMNSRFYTNVVLTVIAVFLGWLCIAPPPVASAERQGPTDVRLMDLGPNFDTLIVPLGEGRAAVRVTEDK